MADYDDEDGGFNSLKGQWDSFLDQPGAKTALLQFGINMMQPPSFGDTGISQVGRALGAAGEASTRQQEIERKEFETESKADLAGARADAATARAGQAGATQELGWARLQRQKDADAATQQHRKLQGQFGALREYQKYTAKERALQAAEDKAWSDPVASALRKKGEVKPPPRHIMSEEEFYASPLWQGYMGGTGAPPRQPGSAFSTPPTGAPTASPTLTGRGVPAGAIVDVQTPEEAAALPPGTKYRTPEGKSYTR